MRKIYIIFIELCNKGDTFGSALREYNSHKNLKKHNFRIKSDIYANGLIFIIIFHFEGRKLDLFFVRYQDMMKEKGGVTIQLSLIMKVII